MEPGRVPEKERNIPNPSPSGHWYLHILSPWKVRDFGCETSEGIEVIMFEQGEHRQQDPKSSQESGGGVRLVPFHLATAEIES